MSEPHFFGYGSLVNRQTHDYPKCTPTKVRGWRRRWRAAGARRWCYLTVVPCAATELWGLAAVVPGGDWSALDERESAYDRHPVPPSHSDVPASAQLSLYAIAPENQSEIGATSPILLSYLDVVVQGYLREFGPNGATHFFETTDGWDTPILDDRTNPHYPRHQSLNADERAVVDDTLLSLGARLI